MRIIICGGRDFGKDPDDKRNFYKFMLNFPVTEVAHGGAKGADAMADEWARGYGLPVEVYPADWKQYGKAAGPIRNQRMLDEFDPHMVIAFPGGRGTADMVRRAYGAGTPVVRLKWVKDD